MTLLTLQGEGPAFPYAGQPMHILAGHNGQPRGFAAMELTMPARFAGPIPHAHDQFDEAIYVLSGTLLVPGDGQPQEAGPGSMFVAPAGTGTASATRPTGRRGYWSCGLRPKPP